MPAIGSFFYKVLSLFGPLFIQAVQQREEQRVRFTRCGEKDEKAFVAQEQFAKEASKNFEGVTKDIRKCTHRVTENSNIMVANVQEATRNMTENVATTANSIQEMCITITNNVSYGIAVLLYQLCQLIAAVKDFLFILALAVFLLVFSNTAFNSQCSEPEIAFSVQLVCNVSSVMFLSVASIILSIIIYFPRGPRAGREAEDHGGATQVRNRNAKLPK